MARARDLSLPQRPLPTLLFLHHPFLWLRLSDVRQPLGVLIRHQFRCQAEGKVLTFKNRRVEDWYTCAEEAPYIR